MSKHRNEIDETKKKKSILQTDIKDLLKVDVLKQDISPKVVLMTMLVVVFIGLYGYFMVYPKFEEYKSASNNVEIANKELNNYQRKLEKMPLLEKRYSELEKEIGIKSKKLSHDMEDGLFIIGLDKMIRELGIMLKDYSVGDIVEYEKFYGIPMTLNIEGDYRRVRELIYFIEAQKNITQVMEYSINTKKTELKKEISKRVYWTSDDLNYHLNETCPNMIGEGVLYGTPAQSGGRKPDSECVGDVSNTIDVEITSVAKGDVSANINFIIYSSENKNIKLQTDKPESWNPGKYNPFQDTLD